MQNLDQIRAAHALAKATELERKVVNKLPALILGNGLLATVAFAQAAENRGSMVAALNAVGDHLKRAGLLGHPTGEGTAQSILWLAQADSAHLQRATDEALAYLSFLKRFAPKRD